MGGVNKAILALQLGGIDDEITVKTSAERYVCSKCGVDAGEKCQHCGSNYCPKCGGKVSKKKVVVDERFTVLDVVFSGVDEDTLKMFPALTMEEMCAIEELEGHDDACYYMLDVVFEGEENASLTMNNVSKAIARFEKKVAPLLRSVMKKFGIKKQLKYRLVLGCLYE